MQPQDGTFQGVEIERRKESRGNSVQQRRRPLQARRTDGEFEAKRLGAKTTRKRTLQSGFVV
jgi:hypothetical protein